MKTNLVLRFLSLGLLAYVGTTAQAESGRWTNAASGAWSDPLPWLNGVVADGAGHTADFSTVDLTAATTVTLDADRTIGRLVFADLVPSADWIVSGGGVATLTLDTATGLPWIQVNNRAASLNLVLAGTRGLEKTGLGTLNLGAFNTYAGSTRVSGGQLFMQFGTAGAANVAVANVLPDGTPLTLAGGILVNRIGTGQTSTSAHSDLVLDPGSSELSIARTSGGTAMCYFSNIVRNAGATLRLNNRLDRPANEIHRFPNATNTAYGILGGFAIENGTEWARIINTTGLIGGGAPYTNAFGPELNTDLTADLTVATADLHTATVRFNTAGARTLTLNGGNVIDSGGILVTATVGANPVAITGGASLTSGNGTDLILHQYNTGGDLTLSTPVVDSGATSIGLTKGGPGRIVLTATNTYTGITYVSGGTLQVGNGGTIGSLQGSAGVIATYGTLAFNRSDVVTLSSPLSGLGGSLQQAGTGTLIVAAPASHTGATTVSAGTLQVGNGATAGSLSNSASLVNAGTLVFNRSDDSGYAGVISGAGSLTKRGAGRLVLSGVNTHSGPTLIAEGQLVLGPTGSMSNSPALQVEAGAVLDVSAAPFTLNGAGPANQLLLGTGRVTGNVSVVTGARVAPGTHGVVGTLVFTNGLSLDGGTLQLDVSSTARDEIRVGGPLALNAGFVALTVPEALPNGSYTLLRHAGALAGSAANVVVTGFSQPGQIASLSDATPGEIRLVVSAGAGATLVWRGNINATWDLNTTANWTNSTGTASVFRNNDLVTFDDTAALFGVNLAGSVAPAQARVDASRNYTFSGTGKISGGGGLVKSRGGTLTLLTINDYTGPTVIEAGTLLVGDGLAPGQLGFGPVTNQGTLVFAQPDVRTVANAVAGTGSLAHVGPTNLILDANNSYSGPTLVGAGSLLQVGSGGSAGSLGTGPVILTNSTLVFNRAGTLAVPSALTGSGSVLLNGSGTVTLSGANSYDNTTTITSGRLKLGASEVIPDGGITLGGLILNGGATAAGTFDLNGFNESVNSLAGTGGVVLGRILNDGGSATNQLTVGDDVATTIFDGLILDNSGAGGKVSLLKRGTGSLTLRAANSYSGGTRVAGGLLGLGHTAAAGTGGIVLSNGATLTLTDTGGQTFPGNTVTTAPGATASLNTANLANGFGGQFVGEATSTNLILGPASFSAAGTRQFQNFLGTVQIEPAGQVRFSAQNPLDNGGENTTFVVLGTVFPRNTGTVRLGALEGTGTLGGPSATDGTGTFVIGAKGLDTEFAGTIAGAAPRISTIVKVGPGRLILSGSLTYDGATTVSNGVLALVGSTGPDLSTTLAVRSNAVLDVTGRTDATLTLGAAAAQSLTGGGTIRGSLAVGANSSLAPGDGVGVLTITKTATLDGALTLQINRTNTPQSDRIEAESFVTSSGTATLTLTNAGPASFVAGDVFRLFSRPVTNITVTDPLPDLGCATLAWTNKLAVNGTFEVVGTSCGNFTPTNLTFAVTGGTNLDIGWPVDQIGWRLLSQTNGLEFGVSPNPLDWTTVPGSTQTNRHSAPMTNRTGFYQLVYP